MAGPCHVDENITLAADHVADQFVSRRGLLRRMAVGAAGLTCADFLGFFQVYGLPDESKLDDVAADATEAADDPRFLIYWYLEGGWAGYDMFNPVMTENNVRHRLKNISEERYRVLRWGDPDRTIGSAGNILYGYLAEPGKDLFPDMAVISSMHTGSGHSRDRLKVHMGDYGIKQSVEREDDERSVMQAFAEVYGQCYLLPSLSWHWWLSDGELNEAQYTGRRGYYHALGPAHAHTIYAGTPDKLRGLLLQVQREASDGVNRHIDSFLAEAHRGFFKDANIEAVRSYHSARQIYMQMAGRGRSLDPGMVKRLFADPVLREDFSVNRDDEKITYRSVNGNKARSKFSPNTNVQAMMSYELMRAGLTCGFFIESRDVRRFDSHHTRSRLWKKDGTPVGMPDQSAMMRENLWDPLHVFVKRLKDTEYRATGKSLFDHANIVLTSEFGRTLHGNVDGIVKKNISDEKKDKEIGGQDISAHWKVTSCAFLGGNVRGNLQYGAVGKETLHAIPLLPDGSLDPNYDPASGKLRPGRKPHPRSFVPNHGHVYATALALSGIQPRGCGRNVQPPMNFVVANSGRA